MLQVKSSTLYGVSLALGALFTGWIYYNMHFNIPWDWEAPGTGRLPHEIVEGFLDTAYGDGQGAVARAQYFAPSLNDATPLPLEAENGVPTERTVHRVVAQGLDVVVFQTLSAARGQEAQDVIDVFETNRGRITARTRHFTDFAR